MFFNVRKKRNAAKQSVSQGDEACVVQEPAAPDLEAPDPAAPDPAAPEPSAPEPAAQKPAAPDLEAPEYTCIGIVSDTHAVPHDRILEIFSGEYQKADRISRTLIDAAVNEGALTPKPCDLIIHAGDIGNAKSVKAQRVIDYLEVVAPVIAVMGNCDRAPYRTLQGPVPLYASFTHCGITFAVFHKPGDLAFAVRGDEVNPPTITPLPLVGIHGHTHVREITQTGEMLTVCPGSPTRPRGEQCASVMVMYVSQGKVLAIDAVAV